MRIKQKTGNACASVRPFTYSHRHFAVNFRFLAKISLKKPVFLSRLVRNYARALANPNRPPIRLVDVALTYDCNMDCIHCSAKGLEQPDQRLLTSKDYKKIAKKLLDAGVLIVNFTGGEPLLRKDLGRIIKCFSPKKTLISISTNGIFLTPEKLDELKTFGVDSINISLDAANPSLHDAIRNSPGSFEKALNAAKTAAKKRFKVNLCYVLTSQNLHTADLDRLITIGNEIGANVHYNLAVPIGAWKTESENLLTPKDRRDLNALMEKFPHSRTDQETNYFRKGCGAIKEKLYITAYGDVMPCPFIQVSFGDILTDSISQIRQNAFLYRYFNKYPPVCLAAEDMEFIKNTRCYGKDAQNRPMPVFHTKAFKDLQAALVNKRELP